MLLQVSALVPLTSQHQAPSLRFHHMLHGIHSPWALHSAFWLPWQAAVQRWQRTWKTVRPFSVQIALLAMPVVTTVSLPRKKSRRSSSKNTCSEVTMLMLSKPRSPTAKTRCPLLVRNLDLTTLTMLQTGCTSRQPSGTEEAHRFFYNAKLLPFFLDGLRMNLHAFF